MNGGRAIRRPVACSLIAFLVAAAGAPEAAPAAGTGITAQAGMKTGGTAQVNAVKLVDGTGVPAAAVAELEDLPVLAVGRTPLSVSLSKGDPQLVDGSSVVDAYLFHGRGGQTVTVVMRSVEVDAYLIVLGPDGREIASNDDALGTDSWLTFTLPRDRNYVVLANSRTAGEAGSYSIDAVEGTASNDAAAVQPTGDPDDRYALLVVFSK